MRRKDSFHLEGDRYVLDFGECSAKKGFAQIDTNQDAWYHGMWANPSRLRVVSYCEGDLTVLDFDDDAEFIQWMIELAAGDYFKGIDAMMNEEIKESFISLSLGDLLH